MRGKTLAEWLAAGPVIGQRINGRLASAPDLTGWTAGPVGEFPDGIGGYVVADVHREDRSHAWSLADYAVSGVSGGSIWFVPRRKPADSQETR